jgi:heme O synthase-like polyprenyltransferase
MFKRLQIYLREMFPVKVYLPFAFIIHYTLFFTVQLLMGSEQVILSVYSLIGVVTIFGSMLIMRIFDELKDEAVDKALFASRPYPRGDVKKSDLLFLLFVTIIIVAALNSVKSYTLPFFLASVVYCYLTYKWFFFRKQISTNLLLALATHQPLTLVLNTYVASTAMVQSQAFEWNPLVYWSIVLFFIPIMSWEISRKIKARGTENAYVTYSSIFGSRQAAGISLFIQLSYAVGLILAGLYFQVNIWHLIIQVVLLLWFLAGHIRFIISPSEKNNILKKNVELHSTLSSIAYLVYLLIHTGIAFKWFIQ